jgi:competence protein ComEC
MLDALSLVSLAFVVGVAAGEWLAVGTAPALVLAGGATVALILARRQGRRVGVSALALSLSLGVLAVAGARPRPPLELLDPEPWTIEGEVVAAPERSTNGVRVPIDLIAVERQTQRRSVSLRVLMMLDGPPLEPLLPGDWVRATTRLRAPRGFINPGAPDASRRAAADGIAATGSTHAGALSRLARPPHCSLARAVAGWRARMLAEVRARLSGDAEALVSSLVLGDRGDIRPPLDDAFRTAGVSHVLSVSGLHLAMAAFLFYVGLRRLLVRLPSLAAARPVQPFAAAAAMPAVLLYTLLTGAAVATVRSCVVALVWLGAVALGRRTTAVQAMAIAALVILCGSPLELFDPSFQLSFAAALGTSLLARRWSPSGRGGAWPRRLGRWALRLIAASAAAIVATAPIAAWHFSQLAPAGIVSNLVVVPLSELGIVPSGLTGCILALLHLPGAATLLALAGLLARAMAWFTIGFAGVAPAWRVAQPTWSEIAIWYVGLGAIVASGRRGWRVVTVCALLVAVSMGGRKLARLTSHTVTATFLDVGQGDACVVELPRGRVLVVDGGGSFDPGFDPGKQVIVPFLWRRGITRIDLLVLSHPHPDHANGLAALVEQFPVAEVWTNGQPTEQPGTRALLAAAARHGVPLGRPRPLELGGARIEPLAPFDDSGGLATDLARSENDNSLVIDVRWQGRRILFAGDLEADGEATLLARAGPSLAADVVKVPHHGSRTSSTAPFVAATHPSLAVISVGERNRWGFPNPGVVARWRDVGARVLRTDRDGGVTVTLDGRGRVAAVPSR